jgi:hypothetical protein
MSTNLPASSGLNLELTLNNPAQMPDLMMAIAAKQESTFTHQGQHDFAGRDQL